jgi:hypothetical protein
MMSARARQARRGDMSEARFREEMAMLGFVPVPAWPMFAGCWTHPDTGLWQYDWRFTEGTNHALGRLADELAAQRRRVRKYTAIRDSEGTAP